MTDTGKGETTRLHVDLSASELRAVEIIARWWRKTCKANDQAVEPDTLRGALEASAWLHDFFQTTVQHAMANADEQPVRH